MAKYKVSYKMLRQQGEELKNVAKLLDGYAEKIKQTRSNLGNDDMLSSVRNNLNQLSTQLGEMRAITKLAGDVLTEGVEGYSALETRQVKKVDSLKAHNRDFYKNPVVVASVGSGGGSGGGASTGAVTTATTTQSVPETTSVQYTETNIQYTQTTINQTNITAAPVADVPSGAVATAATAAAGAGILGAAAGVGATLGMQHLKNKKEKEASTFVADSPNDTAYDPELELQIALEKVRRLNEEEEEPETSIDNKEGDTE